MVASSSGSMVRSGGEASASTSPSARAKGHSVDGRRSVGRGCGPFECAGVAGVRCSSATISVVKPLQPPEERPNRLGPLRVDEGDLRTGVLQPVAQLFARPPCVERDDDGPGQGDGPEGHDPFGQIPHGDGDPVARIDRELGPAAGGPRCRRSGSASAKLVRSSS